VVPQEFGLHLDTRWFSLSGPAGGRGLTVSGDRLFAFSALPFSAGDLTRATHAHQLVPRAETYVQIDAAHRGLGTAACGPDTHPRFRVGPGSYRWTWYLSQSGRRARPT
jgi:beta-galactosidase